MRSQLDILKIASQIKESVRNLDGYVVPQNLSLVKLNQNESPFDLPLELKQEITHRLLKLDWNRYPNNYADSLRKKVSKYIDFSEDGIIIGTSSNELIQSVIYAFCNTGDTFVTVKPGYPVFKRIATVMDVQLIEVPLDKDFKFDCDAIITAAQNAKMVLLASPNNPTGTFLPINDISKIARNIPGAIIIDEAYYEFCNQSARELLDTHSNIIVIRTFSKAFNLAGIRLSYMFSHKEIIQELRKSKLPFSVAIFQQLVGEVVMDNIGFMEENVRKILTEKEKIMAELNDIPHLHPIPSFTNFILIQSLQISAQELFDRLYSKGVILRYFNTPELKHCLRLTIGNPQENKTFLEKLKEVIAETNI